MAPAAASSDAGTPAPLADWFFVCGVEREQLRWEEEEDFSTWAATMAPKLGTTIEEDGPAEGEQSSRITSSQLAAARLPAGSNRSSQRHSKLSDEVRLSLQSVKLGDGLRLSADERGTASNRSSATIKASQVNGTGAGTPVGDFDFEKALRKFASERDDFLADLSLSAGAVIKSKQRPKTQVVTGDDASNLKSSMGSIRRRISIRDMTSMKRQQSLARHSSVRNTKRMSNYNSVIPSPQPLNTEPNMHPLKRRFEPVLLDRYPMKSMVEETKRRVAFPDYVPMFTFPNDINVVSSDERPRSTWHGFAMTSSNNTRVYGICILVWMPLNQLAAEQLERVCEQWRRKNMSDEERELAASLGERLVVERAKLSSLLARLPTVAQGTPEREKLEEDISGVEEKIGLMTDLLRPVRHGAASKIEGLTDGDTGFWIPRAYGVIGSDPSLTSFWKEWLRAIAVPMTNGGVLRVPPTSPKVGMWQPLESYVVNLCAESLLPVSSKFQVELMIRELRIFARKEAINELPGSRGTDLYALFRALSIPNIVFLFEFLMSESRIILISSYTAMLHLVSKAMIELMYPFTWSGVFIPVLPSRLIQALEAPCPYIVGIERRYENIELPTDDFVLVDLDQNQIESTIPPVAMPKQQRRKLTSLLQMAAPHHNRFGVQPGPPAHAVESFPWDAFSSENPGIFSSAPSSTKLSLYAGLSSTSFGSNNSGFAPQRPVFNAFMYGKDAKTDRPTTAATLKDYPEPMLSPVSGQFHHSLTRSESSNHLQQTLREKRSGHFDSFSRRSSSFGVDRRPTLQRPPAGIGHQSNPSISTISTDGYGSNYAPSMYAPSTYAQSTLAASTIMPQVLMQPVHNTETTQWIEGHCFQWNAKEEGRYCEICEEKCEDGVYRCKGCGTEAHARCIHQATVVCSMAFHPEQIRAAFVRCFASLLYTYRKFLQPVGPDKKKKKGEEEKKNGKSGPHARQQLFQFHIEGFIKSLPRENAEYVTMLQQTQAFNEFINERETKAANDPTIVLFDQVIGAKKNRGGRSFFGKTSTSFLSDTSDHLWRSIPANQPTTRVPGDYRTIISRMPAKLDANMIREPRTPQGVPRLGPATRPKKKSMLSTNGQLAASPPT